MRAERKIAGALPCASGRSGNLLPHVVVPAVMAQHLMPLWGLSAGRGAG